MKSIASFEARMRPALRPRAMRTGVLRFACALLALYGAAAHALNAPSADETFTSNIVYVGGVTRMKLALHNNDGSDVTGVQLSDAYPAGMANVPVNAVVGNTCGGTVTTTTNPVGFTLSGGILHPSGCEIVINVTGTQAGVGNPVTNTTSTITSSNAPPGAPASATLTVAGVPLLDAPDVALTPFPGSLLVGGNSTLMLTVSNPNVTTIVGAQFQIDYPTPLHIVNVSGGALLDENLCSTGEALAVGGDSRILVTNFSIPGGGACVFFLEATGTSAGTSTIHTGSIASANAALSNDTTADVTVNAGTLLPTPSPQVDVSPSSVRVGGTTQVTFGFTNADPANAITGMRMESLYGMGLANGSNALVDNSCGGFVLLHPHDGNTSDFHLLDGTIPAGGHCSVVVNVTGTQTGLTPSVLSSNIRSANAGAGGFASASVAVTSGSLMSAATAGESFAPATIQLGDTSEMTITLANSSAFAITGAQFNDFYPDGIRNGPGVNPGDVIVSNTCGGTIAAVPNDDYAGLSNGTVPPLGSCAVIIKVAGKTSGQWINSTGPIFAANALTGNPALSGLTVQGNGSSIVAPTVTKSFADPSILIGNSTQMKISVQNNDGANSLLGLKFTDLYPAGIRNAQSGIVVLNNCGGTLTAPQGGGSAQLDGGQIPPGEHCDVILKVVGAQEGHWTNNTGLVTSDNAEPGDNASASIDVLTLAPDLTIAKSHVGHFSRGQTGAVYKLIAQNGGAGPTVGLVSVTDTLPQGLTASALDGPGWSCVLNTMTCTRSDALSPGSSYPAITVTVDVAANAPASVTNSAAVSGGGEVNTANDVASDPATVDPASTVGDLTLTKFHAGNFSQGQQGAEYFLIAHNIGPIATSGAVTVSDALPQGLTATSVAGPGWTCTLAPLNCTRSDPLAPGASYPAIALTVDVDANAAPMLTNSAAASGGGETNNANDQASDPTSIDASSAGPDLALTKSHAGSFSQGQSNATYSLVVHNVGGAASAGLVTVTDALPPEMTVVGMSGPGWTCTPSTKTCTRSDALAQGQDYPAISLRVFVAANAPASLINWATASGGGESNLGNDAAADPTSIDAASASSDLTVTKTHTGNFSQGQTGATYSIIVANTGGAPTSGTVTVVDTLPASLTATSISGGISWNCTLSPLQCTRSDALFDGLTYPPITLTVDVAANAPAVVTNTASVSGGGETNTGNNLANDPTTIVPNGSGVADLAIGKSHVGNFSQGQQGAVYTLLVQNVGAAATTGQVTVVDTLPQALAIVDMHGANWTCVTNTKTCTRSDALPAGSAYEAIQVIVDVAQGAPPAVTNQASVSGGGETSTGNDTASDPTTIDPFSVGPDLTLSKSHVGNFGRGETAAAYTLKVTNAGGGPTAGAVTVTDTLPASLTLRAMEGQGWTCVAATKTCTRSDVLSAGSSYPDITLTVDVASNAPASVVNTASVSGGGENNTANNAASDPTTILAPTAGNHAPLGIGDAIQVGAGDTSSDIVGDKNVIDSVVDNDVDLDSGDVMHAVQASNPAHGTLVFHVDGTFAYTNTDNVATDSFTYKACDLFACSPPTTVTITIGANLDNHAPFAVGDAIEVVAHGASEVLVGDSTSPSSVLDNDLDFDGDSLIATKLTEPAHGTVTFDAAGAFHYQNDPVDVATSDGFLYSVCDSHGACDLGVVQITIGNGPPNTPPSVIDDAIQVAPGQQTAALIGDFHVPASVLDNDTDADGEPLTASKAADLVAGSGTLTFHGDGTFNYANDPASPVTSDSFLYQACDPRGACKAGFVTITITNDPMDQLPAAQDDAIEVAAHGTATTLIGGAPRLTANDTDPDPGETAMLTARLISAPANGHVTIQSDGSFVYVNDDPALGFDEFDYEACDPQGACEGATVTVTIDTTAPAVTCILPRQLGVVGDTVNLDLSLLFAPPASDTLTYSVTNAAPSLSIVGSLLSGTLDTSGIYVSTLKATAVTGGGTASEDVTFEVLPEGEILLRNGFDEGDPNLQCQ